MNVAELKRGVADGTLVRNPDGSVRPTSLREQLGLSVVRRLDKKRGITTQDILQHENLKKMARRHFADGRCFKCKLLAKCKYEGKLTDNTRCFSPDGKGGCKNKVEEKKMSDNSKIGKRVCVCCYYLLCAALLTAKTCGWVGWSWWWVTAPLWIPFSIIVLVISVCIIGLCFENNALEDF